MSRRRPARRRQQHPRERLLQLGTRELSNADLLEILLHGGGPGSTSGAVARELLTEHGSLIGLSKLHPADLKRRGLGKAKAAALAAAFELAQRIARERLPQGDLLDRPDSVAVYLGLRYGLSEQETMGALYLNVRNRLIGESEVYRGTLGRSAVEPRAILKEGLMRGASSFILFHTHPSGDPAPSEQDLTFTRRLAEAGDLVGVKLLDHMILGGGGRWTSLNRRGW
jgi:DNA repair protein RadC